MSSGHVFTSLTPSCVPHVQIGIGFVSPSGSGKTTLLERMALNGYGKLDPPEGGEVPVEELEAMLEAQ